MTEPKIITGKEIRNKAWLTVYEENDEYVYTAEYEKILSERDQLKAENERLRELVDDFSKAYTEMQRIITGSEGGCDETT